MWFSDWLDHIGNGRGMRRKDESGIDWEVRRLGSVFETNLPWDKKRAVQEVHVPASWWTDVRRTRAT